MNYCTLEPSCQSDPRSEELATTIATIPGPWGQAMASGQRLMIFGASARAAAFSALRAGLEPWCADLFADRDLQARCSVARIAPSGYPGNFGALVQSDMPG